MEPPHRRNRFAGPLALRLATVEKTLMEMFRQAPLCDLRVATAGSHGHRKMLQAGDVIGFVSRRSELDFFHTGFIAFDRRGALAASARLDTAAARVVDDDMASFVAATGVKYVTLLRPKSQASAQSCYAAAALPLGCTSAV